MPNLEYICNHEICEGLGIEETDIGPLFLYACLRCKNKITEKIKGGKYEEIKVKTFGGFNYTFYRLKLK